MKGRWTLLILVLVGIILPSPVWANFGTPLIWNGLVQLTLGNAVIGLGEGLLLAWLFTTPVSRCVKGMILANYVSAWIGLIALCGVTALAIPMDLNNLWQWFWILAAVAYGLTLIIEWPFVLWCLHGRGGLLRQSLWASLAVQSASYGLLFGLYWMVNGTTLYTQMEIVDPAELHLPESVLVYFIGSSKGEVWEGRLSNGELRRVQDLRSTGTIDRLFLRPDSADPKRTDLVALMDINIREENQYVDVLRDLPVVGPQDKGEAFSDRTYGTEKYKFPFGEVPLLDRVGSNGWNCNMGFGWSGDLRATNRSTGESVGFSYGAPFGGWWFRDAVILPSDKVLFQLGADQICAFDPATRRVALLWHGRGPVAVIERERMSRDL